MTAEEEEDEFLLVEDERMEDVVIISEPSSDNEQDYLMPSSSPALITTDDLEEKETRDGTLTTRDGTLTLREGELVDEDQSVNERSVETGCQTDNTRSYTETIVENIVQTSYTGGKCLTDGCSNLLQSLKIGTAPGNFTGTLREDLSQIATHVGSVFSAIGRELTLERIKYKLFM